MNKKLKSTLLYTTVAFTAACNVSDMKENQNNETKQPNIIVMLIDDAGYADFGFAGCKDLKTPNIDKLAENGVVFSDAHVSATVSGPSRAGLITGRYQQRFGFECNPPTEFTGIDVNEKTIADAMKQAGYTTAAFGKWHLGDKSDYQPNRRGFDYFWGFLAGGRSYFPDEDPNNPHETHSIKENDEFTTFTGYLTDVLGNKAVEFIDRNKENPFFIYWSPNAVHTPMHATKEDLDLFKGHPRQKLAAMTWALDRAVGSIVDKLKTENLLDNTLIFFLSDNGGAHNNQSSNEPLKGFKGNKYEGGHRVPFFIHYPAKIEGGREFNRLTSSLDIFATSVDAAGGKFDTDKPLDGVSLIPYLTGKKNGNPHDKLFWRKDKMAASRIGDYKMIRVENMGYRLYNLAENLLETNNLTETEPRKLADIQQEMKKWENELVEPLWTEGNEWDTITWMIHEDYFLNREVRVKNPQQLKKYLKNK